MNHPAPTLTMALPVLGALLLSVNLGRTEPGTPVAASPHHVLLAGERAWFVVGGISGDGHYNEPSAATCVAASYLYQSLPWLEWGKRRSSDVTGASTWSALAARRFGAGSPPAAELPPAAEPSAFGSELAWGLGARLSVGSHAELGGEFLFRAMPALGFGLRAELFGLFGPQPEAQPCECALNGKFAGAFAELRGWPGFVISPYGRVGGGYAAYVHEYWQDGPESEKRRAAGATLEGGLELHPGSFSLRVYGSLLGFVHHDKEAPRSLGGFGLQLGFMHTLG